MSNCTKYSFVCFDRCLCSNFFTVVRGTLLTKTTLTLLILNPHPYASFLPLDLCSVVLLYRGKCLVVNVTRLQLLPLMK